MAFLYFSESGLFQDFFSLELLVNSNVRAQDPSGVRSYFTLSSSVELNAAWNSGFDPGTEKGLSGKTRANPNKGCSSVHNSIALMYFLRVANVMICTVLT